jgi:cellulose synthase/poly-beta-1,6-N-acetylglucosamine synthase-like glycosyltransferase
VNDFLPDLAIGVLVGLVLVGALPLVAGCWQYALIGLHGFRNHLDKVEDITPRTAVIVPAWNEASVIAATVDRLVDMDYPEDSLRVYVVDDASDDGTPEILQGKQEEFPGRVFHLRREQGGQGKAHTLNHGLDVVLSDWWPQAVLILDADVIFERDALRKMVRHLADPEIGAVTAYIKEGSEKANYLKRFIGFEYITAQAAARRTQNVLGAMACLAGGAQLHSRLSIETIGGRIDTSTLAEDTITTFLTQLKGHRAIFEGNATVWAEEPGDIGGLWKQRLRWARGNVHVNKMFRKVWFNRRQGGRLGGISFGLFWFSTFLMPAFMITSSAALITLYFIDYGYSLDVFRALWMINAVTYVVITSFTLMIDPETAKRAWFQGILFPGLVALVIIVGTCYPPLFETLIPDLAGKIGIDMTDTVRQSFVLFAYLWLTLSMIVAWLAKVFETKAIIRHLSPLMIYISGYGPLLSAITFAAYVKEIQGAESKWDKTEKSGQITAGNR